MTFVVGVLKAIAWPACLLVFVFWLRKPIRDLVPLLRKLKVKEFELEFAQVVAQLEVVARPEAGELTPNSTTGATGERHSRESEITAASNPGREDEVLRLALISPRAAIMESWVEVEAAAGETAASFWNPGDRPEIFRKMGSLGEYLLHCGVIDSGQLVTFNKLRELRNKAVHAEELNIGVGEIRKYIELAFNLAKHIRSA